MDLSGVSATLLSNLARRATAARAKRPLLNDPLAVEAVERLDFDFTDISPRGASWHALRVATFDTAVRRFLNRSPDGTVVALGEGLETQFWRVDNGRMRWLTVDLPPVLDLRRRVLPEESRQHGHPGSALDLRWVEEVEAGTPVLVTAQGLLPYFDREQVHALIAAMAKGLPGASFVFDVVPEKMLELVRKTSGKERDQAVELWTWLFDPDERASIADIPGVARLRDLWPPFAPGVAPVVLRAVRCLPRTLRYALPVLPVLEAELEAFGRDIRRRRDNSTPPGSGAFPGAGTSRSSRPREGRLSAATAGRGLLPDEAGRDRGDDAAEACNGCMCCQQSGSGHEEVRWPPGVLVPGVVRDRSQAITRAGGERPRADNAAVERRASEHAELGEEA